MSVTINDVAREAGVSKSTVSKVLNNWTTISPATVAKVKEAIKKLNYTPNSRAVNFAKRETKNIIYLTNLAKNSAYNNPHMFDIMCGVHKALFESGYTLTLVDTSNEKYPGEQAAIVINSGSSDGIIIHGSSVTEELSNQIYESNIPHIIIGHFDYNERLCWVDTSHILEGEYAAAHMWDCGYTDTIFITGKKNEQISSQRLKGFKKKMLNYGVHIPTENIWYTNSTKADAYRVTIEKLSERIKDKKRGCPQAILCENSVLASAILKALNELSLSIPNDIAFLGFDQYPYSSIMYPVPTVINIDVFDLGYHAGQMMIRKLENPDLLVQSITTLPCLIQGRSTILK